MLRISKLSDYAIVILAGMAARPHEVHTSQALADRTGVAHPTVSKLLKCLTQKALLRSVRGRHGGYALARSVDEVSVADILNAVEGPVAMTECSLGAGACEIESGCHIRTHWQHINRAVQQALGSVTLATLAENPAQHRGGQALPADAVGALGTGGGAGPVLGPVVGMSRARATADVVDGVQGSPGRGREGHPLRDSPHGGGPVDRLAD